MKSKISFKDLLTNKDRMEILFKMPSLTSQNLSYSKIQQCPTTIKKMETTMTIYMLNHNPKRVKKKKRPVTRRILIHLRN